MNHTNSTLRNHARQIWQAAVDAVRPQELIQAVFADKTHPLWPSCQNAPRIIVVGGGKAGAAMAEAIEAVLGDQLEKVDALINVPASSAKRQTKRIRLHAARPDGTNQPTEEGVTGAEQILDLVANAGPEDVGLCLLSGGGSALLPAPVKGVSLADKQQLTELLHKCGATINEMNAVRKHLSRIKGGRLAQAFKGRALFSLLISDVIGDPLDVIASGPTAADPTTFADAWHVLEKYDLLKQVPASVQAHLQAGGRGDIEDTPKTLPDHIHNHILGNNLKALQAAERHAKQLGYFVLNLGSYWEGETRDVGIAMAGLVRSIQRDSLPCKPPVCVLSGGETTVTLAKDHGEGGRNQEMVLAMMLHLGEVGLRDTVVLCGGTDGEDGPTDAAGALADADTWKKAEAKSLRPGTFLSRNDAYNFFKQTDDLLKTGLTQTNVMDVRVLIVNGVDA